MNKPSVSAGVLHFRAMQFRALFDGTADAWEFTGCVRRWSAGDEIVHLVRPKRTLMDGTNLVWKRGAELSLDGRVGPWREIEQHKNDGHWLDDDAAYVEFRHDKHPFKHTIVLATHANWGMMLARTTGPKSYWQMLSERLHHAGVLKIHRLHVCWMDRSTPTPKPVQLEVPDEKEFFAMARTTWKEPGRRFERLSYNQWAAGMLKEYYPPGMTAFASPAAEPSLFPNDKPAWSALDPRARAARLAKQRRSK
jgi:hypothetical protein